MLAMVESMKVDFQVVGSLDPQDSCFVGIPSP